MRKVVLLLLVSLVMVCVTHSQGVQILAQINLGNTYHVVLEDPSGIDGVSALVLLRENVEVAAQALTVPAGVSVSIDLMAHIGNSVYYVKVSRSNSFAMPDFGDISLTSLGQSLRNFASELIRYIQGSLDTRDLYCRVSTISESISCTNVPFA